MIDYEAARKMIDLLYRSWPRDDIQATNLIIEAALGDTVLYRHVGVFTDPAIDSEAAVEELLDLGVLERVWPEATKEKP